ncbi:MAG: hypothetical protein RXS42_07200, partial [Nitrososphaeria archaeon]
MERAMYLGPKLSAVLMPAFMDFEKWNSGPELSTATIVGLDSAVRATDSKNSLVNCLLASGVGTTTTKRLSPSIVRTLNADTPQRHPANHGIEEKAVSFHIHRIPSPAVSASPPPPRTSPDR